jgi:hypothetical protein
MKTKLFSNNSFIIGMLVSVLTFVSYDSNAQNEKISFSNLGGSGLLTRDLSNISPVDGCLKSYDLIFPDFEANAGAVLDRDYEFRPQLPEAGGNVYYHGAEPCENEKTAKLIKSNPKIKLEEIRDEVYLTFNVAKQHKKVKSEIVTSDLLVRAEVPDQPFMDYDGSYLTIDIDYLGNKRKHKNPTAGPFENLKTGEQRIKVWPKK